VTFEEWYNQQDRSFAVIVVTSPKEYARRAWSAALREAPEGKVLVDRENLREAFEAGASSAGGGRRVTWCPWPDCDWSADGDPHSGTCPLAETV